jgi:DNA-binding CsgD family transcriptional regulator
MESDYGCELTQREFQILELVAQGFSAKEVAQKICIAPRTVEGHIDTIKLKLRARNRTHMVVKAIAARVLTSDGHPKRGAFGVQSPNFISLGS